MHPFWFLVIFFVYPEVGSQQAISLKRREYLDKTLLKSIKNGVGRFSTKTFYLNKAAYTIDLTNFINVQYFGTVYVGTPKQPFELLFDTGSDVTWIPGPNDTDSCGALHRTFNPSASRSYKDLNQEISIDYVQGRSILGMATEMLTIGDMTINNQEIGLAKSGDCEKNQFDGIMGMSFRNPSRNTTPVFETMVEQQVVPAPIFSFYFNRNGNQGGGGELFLGGWNNKYVDRNEIKYMPILDGQLWKIPIKSVYFGSLMVQPYCEAILDTGTSNIVGPKTSIDRIKSSANGAYLGNFLTVKCSSIGKVPPLMFNINGTDYVYSADDLVLRADDELCIMNLRYSPDDENIKEWTFGYPFLSKVYSIFDIENKKVALVQMRSDYPVNPTEATLPPITRDDFSGTTSILSNLLIVSLGLLIVVVF